MAKLLRAKQTFFTGDHRKVSAGDLVDAKDPVVKGKAHLFEPIESRADNVVEQATAAPGESRTVSKKTK